MDSKGPVIRVQVDIGRSPRIQHSNRFQVLSDISRQAQLVLAGLNEGEPTTVAPCPTPTPGR
jgi:hypothetical protein